jgi:hypothetical protein
VAAVYDMIWYISSFLFFALRILKKKNVVANQRIHVELTGLRDLNVVVGRGVLSALEEYSFSKNDTKIVYERDIDASEKWSKAFLVTCDIYRDLYKDLGIMEIADTRIRDNVKAILIDIDDLRTEYTTPGIPRVDLKEVFEE